MATGTLKTFNKARLAAFKNWNLATDVFKVIFINSTTVPTVADATPNASTYTEVSGGNFPAGGTVVTPSLVEAAGVVTFDLTVDLTLASNAGNPTDVFYAVVINTTVANEALLFVEMNVAGHDAQNGDTDLTWGANIFTVALAA